MARSTNGAHSRDQWQVERTDPARWQIVDRRDRVECAEPCRQATGGGGVPTAAVGEAEGGLLGDRRRPFDLDTIDVVLRAATPVGRGVGTDAVHVLQLDAGLAVVDAVDREVDGRDLTRVDHTLRRLDLVVGDPLVPGGGDLVELDADGVRHHRHCRAPRHREDLRLLEHRPVIRGAPDAHLVLVVTLVVGVVEDLESAHHAYLATKSHERHGKEVVGEAGIDPRREARRATRLAGLGDGSDPVRRVDCHRGPDPRRHRRGAHVDAGTKEGADVPDVVDRVRRRRSVVDQGVGLQVDEGVDVVRGGRPQMVGSLTLETDEAKAAADAGMGGDGELLLVPRVDGRYARVGTIGRVGSSGELRNGVRALVLRGVQRAVVGVGVAGTSAGLWVEAEPVDDSGEPNERVRELARDYRAIVGAIAERLGAGRLREALRGVTDPGALADTAGWWPDLESERKLELLETLDVQERLEKVVAWARDALAELDVAEKIRSEVTDGMERQQREFLLRQQLSAIKKELGEDGGDDVIEEFRRRIAEGGLPEAVRESATQEVDRLERTSEQSPEHGWIRTWLDSLLDIPWGERSDDNLDVNDARRVLDADHTGLSDVKDRIVELLAVRKLRAERGLDATDGRRGAGAILALVGPPGVGKTSLGESVARPLGRKFNRVALGGIHDEAEIRGHRRTYVGARPGRVVRALTEAGTMNPVVLLDEIDKVGADWRGDPSSALLEVLDPAPNHTFRYHYLEVDLDLSDVLFLATANVAETIPGPLLDRRQGIRLDDYLQH